METQEPLWFNLLQQRLQEFYEMPPNGPGNVLLQVHTPRKTWSFVARLGVESLSLLPREVAVNDVIHASLGFSEDVLYRALEHPDDLEPRYDYFGQNTQVSGDMGLMQYFVQLLKRPSEYDLKVLNHVRQHPNQPEQIFEAEGFNFDLILKSIVDNQPLCLRSAFYWDAMQWTADDFKRILGQVRIRYNPLTGREDTFSDLLEQMQKDNNKRVYSSGRGLPDSAQHLFPIPDILKNIAGKAHMWFGQSPGGRLVSKLHLDVYTSLLTQVWGKKTAYLYPPLDFDKLGPLKAFCGYQPFYFNPLSPDYDRYPQAKGLGCFKIELMPGDLLVIPSGWLHALEVDGATLSISRAVLLEDAIGFYQKKYGLT